MTCYVRYIYTSFQQVFLRLQHILSYQNLLLLQHNKTKWLNNRQSDDIIPFTQIYTSNSIHNTSLRKIILQMSECTSHVGSHLRYFVILSVSVDQMMSLRANKRVYSYIDNVKNVSFSFLSS